MSPHHMKETKYSDARYRALVIMSRDGGRPRVRPSEVSKSTWGYLIHRGLVGPSGPAGLPAGITGLGITVLEQWQAARHAQRAAA